MEGGGGFGNCSHWGLSSPAVRKTPAVGPRGHHQSCQAAASIHNGLTLNADARQVGALQDVPGPPFFYWKPRPATFRQQHWLALVAHRTQQRRYVLGWKSVPCSHMIDPSQGAGVASVTVAHRPGRPGRSFRVCISSASCLEMENKPPPRLYFVSLMSETFVPRVCVVVACARA